MHLRVTAIILFINIFSHYYIESTFHSGIENMDKLALQITIVVVRIHFPNKIRYCCGTLIRPNIILTAAHCFFDQNHTKIEINYVKVIILNTRRRLRPKKLIVHPFYNDLNLDYDAAMLILFEKEFLTIDVPFQSFLSTIRNSEQRESADKCVLFGQANNRFYVHINDLGECKSYLRQHQAEFTENMFCAGQNEVPHACVGDSGCPILCKNGVIGLVSFSTSCNREAPVVFTNVTKLQNWIFDVMPKM